jgi:2,5-furandicarboxylate decarboxylase 1
MFMVPDVFCNRLDPSSRDGMSAKLALDATAPLNSDAERAIVPLEAAAWATSFLDKH